MRLCQGQGGEMNPGTAGHRGSRRTRPAGFLSLLAAAVVLSCWTAGDVAVAAPSLGTGTQAVGQATIQQAAAAPTRAADAVKPTPVANVGQTVSTTVKQ